MDGLTEIQQDCLLAISRYCQQHGRVPTRRELAELTGQKSVNGVRQLLLALAKKGYIKIDPPGRRRNITVVGVPPKGLSVLTGPQAVEGARRGHDG